MGSFENADGEGGQEAVSLLKAFGPLSPQAGVARQRLSREEPDA